MASPFNFLAPSFFFCINYSFTVIIENFTRILGSLTP
jgi:hypothetical protein